VAGYGPNSRSDSRTDWQNREDCAAHRPNRCLEKQIANAQRIPARQSRAQALKNDSTNRAAVNLDHYADDHSCGYEPSPPRKTGGLDALLDPPSSFLRNPYIAVAGTRRSGLPQRRFARASGSCGPRLVADCTRLLARPAVSSGFFKHRVLD
jgi:hypothetical protein